MAGAVIYNNTFTFPAATSATQTDTLPLLDLSRVSHLRFLFRLTVADTDAGDKLDIRFQERSDGDFADWDTRLRSPQFLGTLSPSSTAPEDYYMTLPCRLPLTSAELSYEPTGSAGASEVAANSVVGGPLLGKYRPTNGLEPRYRLKLDTTDAGANNNANFVCQVIIWSYSSLDLP